jgi:hypothetical protein
VGVEEGVADGALIISPNPATDHIMLRMSEENVYSVSLFNMIGKEVAVFAFTGTEFTYDITTLPAGLYLVKLTTKAGEDFSAKFIVK